MRGKDALLLDAAAAAAATTVTVAVATAVCGSCCMVDRGGSAALSSTTLLPAPSPLFLRGCFVSLQPATRTLTSPAHTPLETSSCDTGLCTVGGVPMLIAYHGESSCRVVGLHVGWGGRRYRLDVYSCWLKTG